MLEKWAAPITIFAAILAIWFYLRKPVATVTSAGVTVPAPAVPWQPPDYAPAARLESAQPPQRRPYPDTLKYPADLTIDQVLGIVPAPAFDPRPNVCGCEG